MAGKLVTVPNGEIRSTTVNDKGRTTATIHTGRFAVVADVTDDGKVQVPREIFEEMFEVIDPVTREEVTESTLR